MSEGERGTDMINDLKTFSFFVVLWVKFDLRVLHPTVSCMIPAQTPRNPHQSEQQYRGFFRA